MILSADVPRRYMYKHYTTHDTYTVERERVIIIIYTIPPQTHYGSKRYRYMYRVYYDTWVRNIIIYYAVCVVRTQHGVYIIYVQLSIRWHTPRVGLSMSWLSDECTS